MSGSLISEASASLSAISRCADSSTATGHHVIFQTILLISFKNFIYHPPDPGDDFDARLFQIISGTAAYGATY